MGIYSCAGSGPSIGLHIVTLVYLSPSCCINICYSCYYWIVEWLIDAVYCELVFDTQQPCPVFVIFIRIKSQLHLHYIVMVLQGDLDAFMASACCMGGGIRKKFTLKLLGLMFRSIFAYALRVLESGLT